jgi:hypothetical protein
VRKKGPRGVVELTDCWISPSNEDDITFTIQTGCGDIFKLRGINKILYLQINLFFLLLANDAKERQKWIDKLRACSGANAANIVGINNLLLVITSIRCLVCFNVTDTENTPNKPIIISKFTE